MKHALITGATCKDGACSAKFLLDEGYQAYETYTGGVTVLSTTRIDQVTRQDHQDVTFEKSMKSTKIGIVTGKRSLTDRPWVKQDMNILKELGFDVIFIDPATNFLRNLRKVVSCHLLFGWFAFPDAAFYARIFCRKSILNAVGYEVAYYPEFNYGLPLTLHLRPFIALGLKSADKVVAISSESAKWAEFWGKRKVEIIHEGIDTNKFKPLEVQKSTNNVILAVANLEKDIVIRKNLFALINAMKYVIQQMHDAKLVIVGEKLDGYPSLKSLVDRLGLEDKVIFKGKVSDDELVFLYNACDVFVMPSLQEGFPTVCCEALSCGKPVITSNRPSMNEIFTNNLHAVLINPKDHIQMAEAIINVIKDKKLAERISKSGRELVVKNFSRDVRKEKLNEVINRVLQSDKNIGGINMLFLKFYFAYIVLRSKLT
jgi:glycosyltransferase involved in cell wall biosynthesis